MTTVAMLVFGMFSLSKTDKSTQTSMELYLFRGLAMTLFVVIQIDDGVVLTTIVQIDNRFVSMYPSQISSCVSLIATDTFCIDSEMIV